MDHLDKLIEEERSKPLPMNLAEVEELLEEHRLPATPPSDFTEWWEALPRYRMPRPAVAALIALLVACCWIALLYLDGPDVSPAVAESPAAPPRSELSHRWERLVRDVERSGRADRIRLASYGAEEVPLYLRSRLAAGPELLEQLGITVSGTEIRYHGNINGLGYLSYTFSPPNSSVTISEQQREDVPLFDFYPIFITNEDGGRSPRYTFSDTDGAYRMSDEYFHRTVNELIPIQASASGPEGLTAIFWFEPARDLLDVLEGHAGVLASEQRSGAPVDEGGGPVRMQVSPNPGQQEFSLYTTLGRSEQLSLEVVDRNGRTVQTLLDSQPAAKGDHRYTFSFEGLESGLYFLKLQPDGGEPVYSRVFKS